jgi:hypothetical protein
MFHQAVAAEPAVNFNREIRPILSENCFHCHGPDAAAREADLRLDTEAGAKEFAIVSGDADGSELIDRITSEDPDLVMPPPESERSLSSEQIGLLRKWVDEGADYQAHWSLIPPVKPDLPTLRQRGRAKNAIDHFVLAPLESKGIAPAPPTDKETLIRRATFDLIGLPPTLAEIDAFLADQAPDAFSRLLDRLLDREEFGERMASTWLDAARYSDTYGYQVDRDRFVWPWRDWVIKAFNDNLPYDQFVTQQLAGDLLPAATRDQILATTFNRLHPQKVEGGSTPEEFRVEYVADRTQTVATAMMGLTFECCRCHDHKYDPLTQKEYYQLSSFFDNIDEAGLYSYFTSSVPTPALPLPDAGQTAALEANGKAVAAAEQQLQVALSENVVDLTQCLGDQSPADSFTQPILALDFESVSAGPNTSVDGVVGKAIKLTGDDAVGTKVGNFRRYQPFSVSLWINTPDVKQRAVVFHRSRAWTDAGSRGYQLLIEQGRLSWSLIHFWPGNAIRIRTVDPIPIGKWQHVVVTNDGSSRAGGLQIYLNGRLAKTEIVRDHLTKNINGGGGDHIAIGERFRDNGFAGGLVDEFKVYDQQLTQLEVAVLANPSGGPAWLDQDREQWTTEQTESVVDHCRQRKLETVQQKRQTLQQAREKLCQVQDACQEIMVMRELPQRRQSYFLNRGAYDNRGEPVGPDTPAALIGFPDDAPRNRLGLARWLTRPDHPLTSRVAVNRLWQICFGAGLVRTPEDFGSQGEPPTHPELLDWLAVDLMDNGWDVKRAIKQIMMSATYRQSSHHPDVDVVKSDPENRLLARFPSYRLSAEMLRDSALAISGRLVTKIGGPPVRPYELEASFKPSKRDQGEGLYRRSIYTYWKRTGPAPAMMALDAAKRDVCRVQRERTSSPLQAFVLLNGPQYVEAARGLAEQVSKASDDDNEMLQHAFRRLTGRRATDAEIAVLVDLLDKQREYFAADDQRTKTYLSVGDAPPDASIDPVRLAATTVVIATLMNYDEAVMKR